MKRRILTAIKSAVPDLMKMVIEPNDVIFYFESNPEEAFGIREFHNGSLTWRAFKIAEHLPVGEYTCFE